MNTIENVFNLLNDNTRIRSEVIYKANKKNTRTRLKILTPKQLLQRLPIALAQLKAGNYSESLLNEIRQVAYSMYQLKKITKKVHNNIIKSVQSNCIEL